MSLFNKFVSSELRIKTKNSGGSPNSRKAVHHVNKQNPIASAAKAGLAVSSSVARALKTIAIQQGTVTGGGGGSKK